MNLVVIESIRLLCGYNFVSDRSINLVLKHFTAVAFSRKSRRLETRLLLIH